MKSTEMERIEHLEKRLADIEAILLDNLDPISRYSAVRQRFSWHVNYNVWNMRRISKILEIYGTDWFCGKRILELGGGHGEIGAFFASIGADVIGLEGRLQNVNAVNLKYRHLDNFKYYQCNLEKKFDDHGWFDLIINFGLLYHIEHIENHLCECARYSNEILLETEVCYSVDPKLIVLFDEPTHDVGSAVGGVGSKPSPFFIESFFENNDFITERHFSSDLNSLFPCRKESFEIQYDWKDDNIEEVKHYFLADDFWNAFENNVIPDVVLNKLRHLRGSFATQQNLVDALKQNAGDEVSKYQKLIMEKAVPPWGLRRFWRFYKE